MQSDRLREPDDGRHIGRILIAQLFERIADGFLDVAWVRIRRGDPADPSAGGLMQGFADAA